jgi:hypothetical protein
MADALAKQGASPPKDSGSRRWGRGLGVPPHGRRRFTELANVVGRFSGSPGEARCPPGANSRVVSYPPVRRCPEAERT